MSGHRFSKPLNLAVATVISSLFAGYLYLNTAKWSPLEVQYHGIINGRPAPALVLRNAGVTLAHFRLSSTGIFAADGSRQIYFQRLDQGIFTALQQAINQLEVDLDGVKAKARTSARERFLTVLLPRKKIYLVHEEDTRTIAALLWNEERRMKDILDCRGEPLCHNIRLAWGGGVGPLEGPFLDTDLRLLRRGMPRGRWGLGPASSFIIKARGPVNAVISLTVLDPHRTQEILVKGKAIKAQRIIKPRNDYLDIAGKRLYPKEYKVEVMLKPGRNAFRIEYGNWRPPSGRRPGQMAAYLVRVIVGAR